MKHAALLRGVVWAKYDLPLVTMGDRTWEMQNKIRKQTVQELLLKYGALLREHDPDIFIWSPLYMSLDWDLRKMSGVVFSDTRQPNEAAILRALGFSGIKLMARGSERPPQPLDNLLSDSEFSCSTVSDHVLDTVAYEPEVPSHHLFSDLLIRRYVQGFQACCASGLPMSEGMELGKQWLKSLNP